MLESPVDIGVLSPDHCRWSMVGRAGGDQPGVPFDRGEEGVPRRGLPAHRPRRGRAPASPGRRRGHRGRDRRPVHGRLAGRRHQGCPRRRTPPRDAGGRARPAMDPDRRRVRRRAGEPGPDPRDRRGSRGPARQDLGDDLRAKAETLLLDRRAAKLGPTPSRRLFGSRAIAGSHPDPRPRQPAAHLPRRLHLTAQQTPRRGRRAAPVPGRGEAFCAFLENLPASGLPRQGGTATTLTVTIDWKTLLADLGTAGVAVTSTGDKLTADQARRLACQAWIRLRRQLADRRHLVPVINQSTACSRCGSEATRHGTPGECVTPHLGSR